MAATRATDALSDAVVLMDLVMPELDGVAAIERLREATPATRVRVLTSFLDEDKVLPAVRAGAAGYLLKDVEPSSSCARSAPSTAANRSAPRQGLLTGAARRVSSGPGRGSQARTCSP